MTEKLHWDTTAHGELLRRARVSENMTRKELADEISVTLVSVYNWEAGKCAPHPKSIDKLKKLFGEEAFDQDAAPTSANEMNALGSWLLEQRESKSLTRHQLADRSGITYQTIYNIETGRTTSPQQSTIDKLEKAFDTALPEAVDEDISESANIGVEGIGSFTDFDPHADDELPKLAGIYVFYDISDRPVYVGQSGNIADRIRTGHADKFWFRSPIVDKGAYVHVKEEILRKQVEAVMIRFLKSNAVINRQHVKR